MKQYFWLKLPIAVVFLLSAAGKALSFTETYTEIAMLARTLINLPEWIGIVAAIILLGFELVTALALLFGWQEKATLVSLLSLSILFLGVNIFKIISSGEEDCGCFGELFSLSVYTSVLLDCLLILSGSYLFQKIQSASKE